MTPEDVRPVLAGILMSHPGLDFLQGSPEFQDRCAGGQAGYECGEWLGEWVAGWLGGRVRRPHACSASLSSLTSCRRRVRASAAYESERSGGCSAEMPPPPPLPLPLPLR